MENDAKAMRFLLRYSPKVIENTVIDTAPKVLYHISPTDNIKEFVPRVVQRSMKGEDKTVARVCTAGTILDCIRGYAVTVDDFLQEKPGEVGAAGDHDWRGGYYIYAIPTEISLAVNEKLAPIAKWCDERWLVNWRESDQPYPSKVVGQMFYRLAKGSKHHDVDVYVQIFENASELVPFTHDILLGKGCHSVVVKNLDAYYTKGDITKAVKHSVIPLGQYLKAKKVKADMLSYKMPAFLAWE